MRRYCYRLDLDQLERDRIRTPRPCLRNCCTKIANFPAAADNTPSV